MYSEYIGGHRKSLLSKTVPDLLRQNCLAPDRTEWYGDEVRRNSKFSAGTSSAQPCVVRMHTK